MKSERTDRQKQAELVSRQLGVVRQALTSLEGEKYALELAATALTEEPRKLTLCNLEIEFAPIQVFVDKARCTECRKEVLGWESDWMFCPKCGSGIEHTVREDNPFERQLKRSVETILG